MSLFTTPPPTPYCDWCCAAFVPSAKDPDPRFCGPECIELYAQACATRPHPPILEFFGPTRWLSNFHEVDVVLDGLTFRSTEHAYQAAKTLDPEARLKFQALPKPRDAKRLGPQVALRADWEVIKLGVMLDLTRQKFQNTGLRDKLLATGDCLLVEGNTWGDVFWGVCAGVGENHLGRIIMSVRDEIREELATQPHTLVDNPAEPQYENNVPDPTP